MKAAAHAKQILNIYANPGQEGYQKKLQQKNQQQLRSSYSSAAGPVGGAGDGTSLLENGRTSSHAPQKLVKGHGGLLAADG